MCLVQIILQKFEKKLFFLNQQPIENREKKSMAFFFVVIAHGRPKILGSFFYYHNMVIFLPSKKCKKTYFLKSHIPTTIIFYTSQMHVYFNKNFKNNSHKSCNIFFEL
jgi:hypothetical protein